jgi:hypothetical protein
MPFRTPPGAPRNLLSLIDAELRERLEEAIDHACLNAMVSARRTHSEPAPKADDPRDREEFTATVRALLERLRDEIPADADATVRADAHVVRADAHVVHADAHVVRADAHVDEEWRLLALQIARAKALPDYWQRFDAIRAHFTEDYARSGSARRGVLGRLFRRG